MSLTPQEMKLRTKGIFHLSLTPFDRAGNLDVPALKESIRMVTQNPQLDGEDIVFEQRELCAQLGAEPPRVGELKRGLEGRPHIVGPYVRSEREPRREQVCAVRAAGEAQRAGGVFSEKFL